MGKYISLIKKGIHYLKNYDQTVIATGLDKEDNLTHVERVYGFTTEQKMTPFVREDYIKEKDSVPVIHWIIPEPGVGSGGHLNIFRFVTALQKRGMKNRVYVQKPLHFFSDNDLTEFIHKNYPIIDKNVELHYSCIGMPFCHAIVATGWDTAYFVRNFNNTISKFYFVQDFEPYFYAIGSEYKFAENTYRFGFRGLTAGDWLKDKLEKEYNMPCASFHFSYDKELYKPIEKRDQKKRVFFYARPVTPRRAWELGLLALIELYKKIPEIEVVFAGWDISNYYIPFIHLNAGSVALNELADLYAQCDICFVMSLTNLSLLPLEVMASGGVIATQEDANNAWMINDQNAVIIDCDPIHIAEKLADFLEHPEKREPLRKRGIAFAQQTDWEKETEKVYNAIKEGIEEDEKRL